ncbi:E3 ubiquitin-protein ligase DZIP3 [Stylophora pistillata]|uniref:E3 ubiquitin-protein ligase DZIP3 n=1 Tax=Stylophora pistillata TaxID=50429 RepID=A0A2B4SW66_STYPI|nr:E3 ubiquitin-protein ligase DZIP3 [Stylophora pistillata]
MANAAPTTSSTKETTNYARLCRLLVDIGTQALRNTLHAIHAPTSLHAVLAANEATSKSLRAKKVINPIQWRKLFPAIPTSVSSRDFDITLLTILLRDLCGLTAPLTGWDALPAANDLRKEADIARVKYFRNTVYGHAEKASVNDIKFNDYWCDIRDTLVRLGGVTYEAAIDNLRIECMDPEVEDHYVELLSQWKKDEDNIKDQLNEIKKRLDTLTVSKEAVTQAPTTSSTKETTNYARLCRLLVDVGTQALRNTLHVIHAPTSLHAVLAANEATLKSLRAKKVINPIQWRKLFPAIPTSVSSRDFDITLLTILLRDLCGLTAPLTGWDALPAANDLRKEADIARVKYFRNTVYGHAEKASVNDIKFNDYWCDIRDTLVRLGGVTYEAASDNLRIECMDPEVEDHYVELLSQWKKDEDNIKDQLNEIKKRLDTLTVSKEAVTQGQPYQQRKQTSDHSQSTALGKGLIEADLGVEANFLVITRDSGGQQFNDVQEQVTVTVSSQTGNEEVQVVDCKDGHYRVGYKPKSVGRHDIEIRVNGCPLTGSAWKVEVKPHQYKVVRSSGSGELSGPYSRLLPA